MNGAEIFINVVSVLIGLVIFGLGMAWLYAVIRLADSRAKLLRTLIELQRRAREERW